MKLLADLMLYGLAACFGAVFGSFANVVIWRLPRKQSLSDPPRSYCPCCGNTLQARDLMPVLSWLLLGRRCRFCRQPIAARYPLVEALCATCFVVSTAVFGASAAALLGWVLAAVLLCVAFIDAEHQLIPDALVILLAIAGLAAAGVRCLTGASVQPLLTALLGAVTAAAPLLVIDVLCRLLLRKDAFGYGDVKLMAAAGLFLSWQTAVLTLMLSFVMGGLCAVILMRRGRAERGGYIAFGPYLAACSLIAYWWGEGIISWYFGLFGL